MLAGFASCLNSVLTPGECHLFWCGFLLVLLLVCTILLFRLPLGCLSPFPFVGSIFSLSPVPFLHVVLPDGVDFGDMDVTYVVSFDIADHSVNC